jgi:hypothetical protein
MRYICVYSYITVKAFIRHTRNQGARPHLSGNDNSALTSIPLVAATAASMPKSDQTAIEELLALRDLHQWESRKRK